MTDPKEFPQLIPPHGGYDDRARLKSCRVGMARNLAREVK